MSSPNTTAPEEGYGDPKLSEEESEEDLADETEEAEVI